MRLDRNRIQRACPGFLSFALAILAGGVGPQLLPAAWAQRTRGNARNQAKAAARPAPASRGIPMPFRVGESLRYQVGWSRFSDAASVQLSIPEKRSLYGRDTWHYRAAIHTVSPVRTLFTIDDQFDSYTDVSTLETRQYEMYISEMGHKETHILHFMPDGQKSRAPGPFFIVPAGARDALGELYALRGVDWQHNDESRAVVSDGRDIYDVDARLESAKESIALPAGTFNAWRVAVHVTQEGKTSNTLQFKVWFAHDAARTPVLIQADLPFGSLHVELTSKAR